MDGNNEGAPPSTSKLRRNRRRAMEWRKKQDKEKEGPIEDTPGPSTPQEETATAEGPPSEHTSAITATTAVEKTKSRFIRWIRGETIHPSPRKETPKDTIEEDPKALYERAEFNMKLARLEEATNLTMALRHIVRHIHPRGNKIAFPVPVAVDSIQLKCCSLPTEPAELRKLVEMVFRRREEPLDIDELYRDFVITHGRIITDMTKPYPECYAYTRHP